MDYNEYTQYHMRDKNKGDLLPVLRSAIKNNEVIPIDFVNMQYSEIPEEVIIAAAFEELDIPYRPKEYRRYLKKSGFESLKSAVEYLNNFFGEYTDNKLRFDFRKWTSLNDEIDMDIPNELNNLIVRIKPCILNSNYDIENNFPDGRYNKNGVIDLNYNVLRDRDYHILAHEIGHGILGFGHHEKRIGCLMDQSFYPISSSDSKLCEEDIKTLRSLID